MTLGEKPRRANTRSDNNCGAAPNIGSALPKQLRAHTLTKLETENYLKTKSAAPTILPEDSQRARTRSDNDLPIRRACEK